MKRLLTLIAATAAFSVLHAGAATPPLPVPDIEVLAPDKVFPDGPVVPGGIQIFYQLKFKAHVTGPFLSETVNIGGGAQLLDAIVVMNSQGEIITRQYVPYDSDTGKKVNGKMEIYLGNTEEILLKGKTQTYYVGAQMSYDAWNYPNQSVAIKHVSVQSTFSLTQGGQSIPYTQYTASKTMTQAGGFSLTATGDIPDHAVKGYDYFGAFFVSGWGNRLSVTPTFKVVISADEGYADQLVGLRLVSFGGVTVSKVVLPILRIGKDTALVRFAPLSQIVPPQGMTIGIYGAPGSRLSKQNLAFVSVPRLSVVTDPDNGARLEGDTSVDVGTTITVK